ncbi:MULTISPECIES: hypothetical protein [Clostridium]|uniref:Uncharacterized protein n=1 Tax=Clostridium frigoriphilum TaxID=443253 RepID=A0ABU7UVK1_9CLOT|nr:hypothetical protein [Clostridium sp. DSM 17811]MBU3101283.1 hypothetical protein [Clostridium sp. DSM 17811]
MKFFDTFGPYLPDEEFVKEVMYNKLYAAVVTKDENIILNDRYKDSMPDSFYETNNIFDRYAEVEIPLKRIVWKEKARGIKLTKVIDQELTPLENEFKIIFDDNTDVATNGILDAFKLR